MSAVPADPRPMGLTTPNAEGLLPWEEQFARWLALQTARVDHEDEAAAIRVLVGQDLSRTALRVTKRKLAFRRVYQNARAEIHELQLQRAKGRAMAMAPKAIAVYGKAIDALDQEFEKAKTGDADAMAAIRTAPSLLVPFLDRALPKKTETEQTTTRITINLTPEQATGLDRPVMVVEANEVPARPAPE